MRRERSGYEEFTALGTLRFSGAIRKIYDLRRFDILGARDDDGTMRPTGGGKRDVRHFTSAKNARFPGARQRKYDGERKYCNPNGVSHGFMDATGSSSANSDKNVVILV